MSIFRTNHKVYELKYHFVLIIKYRKSLFNDDLEKYLSNIFQGICFKYDFVIETIGYDKNHVHLMVQTLPDKSPSKVFQLLKGISSRYIFKKFPSLKKQLWGGNFWSAGGYAGSVGEGKNADIIRNYIKKQGQSDNNLKLFDFF